MKKSTFSLVSTIALCFGLCSRATAQHTHEEHEHVKQRHDPTTIDMNKAYADFDYAAAEKLMDEKGIPAGDRPGYLRLLKGEHLKKKYPDFVYTTPAQERYKNYRPSNYVMKSSSYCVNAGFDLEDFTNWVGMYGSAVSGITSTGIITTGINAIETDAGSRHTILTMPPINNNPAAGPIVGYDGIALNPITGLADIPYLAPGGGAVSCRLGNAVNGAEAERLIYTVSVTPSNTQFYYRFAVVLQNPTGHSLTQQPYFKITVKDSTGGPVGGVCGIYNVVSSDASTDTSYILISYLSEDLYYRKWQLVGVDLTSQVGHDVTIEFETGDCQLSGHFGYAYIDADCGLINLSTSFCSADPYAQIVAPQGFISYSWFGPNNDTLPYPGGTNDTLTITSPHVSDTFYVHMQSASGCITKLETVLGFTDISLAFSTMVNSCPDGATGSLTAFPTGSGAGYSYLWSTGDTTATASGLAAGTYTLHVESASGLCGVIDTSLVVGLNPLVAGAQTVDFCDLSFTNVVGPAGTNHQWYNMAGTPIIANDTMGVTSPMNGMQFILVYDQTPNGCRDSIIYTLNQVPVPGTFTLSAGPCGVENLAYTATGAPGVVYDVTGLGGSYTFNSGLTTTSPVSLTGLAPGSYTATLTDDGCISTQTFTITMATATGGSSISPCRGDTITLNSGIVGAHNYYDPLGNLISTSATAGVNDITVPGLYIDTVSTGSACQTIYTYTVSFDTVTVTSLVVNNNCYEDQLGSISLTVTHDPPASTPVFSWTGPSGYSASTAAIVDLGQGNYSYTVTSGNCYTNGTLNIYNPSQPHDTLYIFTRICQGNPSGRLEAPAGYSNYQWYFQGNPVTGANLDTLHITNTEAYMYYTVSYNMPPFGCNYNTSYIINDKPAPLFIPDKTVTIFTPNGDGKNDKFYPFLHQNLTSEQIDIITHDFNITIFDRWGKVMFSSNEFLTAWDGKQDGAMVSEGVYFWRATYIPNCANEGEKYEYHGTVQVSY